MKTWKKPHLLLSILPFLLIISCSPKDLDPPKSSAKSILSFSFNTFNPVINTEIDSVQRLITATLPIGTPIINLVPSISISPKATISPLPDIPQDFSKPLIYTITAEDGSSQTYTVNVSVMKSSSKTIKSFTFNGFSPPIIAKIDSLNYTIKAVLPPNSDISKLTPTIIISERASISPNSGVSLDFSKPVNFKVTAEDGTSIIYTATAEVLNPMITGKVVTTQTNLPVPMAIISDMQGIVLSTADNKGVFKMKSSGNGKPIRVKISANGYVSRITNILDNEHEVNIDIIEDKAPFDLDYFGQLAYWTNGNFSATQRTSPLPTNNWDANPNIYIKTTLSIFNNGVIEKSSDEPVLQKILEVVQNSLEKIFKQLTDGKIKINTIEFGKERKHVAEDYWITIEFFDRTNNPQNFSARGSNFEQIRNGVKGKVSGKLDLGINTPFEYCKDPGLGAGLIFHEFGHCLGLSHTTNIDKPNMMAGGLGCLVSETNYSSMELYHSKILYARPRGNKYPDINPDDFAF